MNNPFLIGRRVYLRPLEPEEAPTVAPWVNDPEVNRTILFARPLTFVAERAYLEKIGQSQDDIGLGIVLRESDRLIGMTGLHQFDWRNRHASFGILIGAREEWGKGYATEATGLTVGYAFETLNLNRVWLHVIAGHERAIRAYERAGFRREGVLRQHLYREGRCHDLLTMAVLREEWPGGSASAPG